jgi:hypothetical protein
MDIINRIGAWFEDNIFAFALGFALGILVVLLRIS